jgi:Tol biopolymer transport system component
MWKSLAVLVLAAVAAYAPLSGQSQPAPASLALPEEAHLSNVRQLTFGGENAEAYFSFDGKRLSFQSSANHPCDQIYTMNIDGSGKQLVSTGQGRTTCAHYTPDGQSIVYASTHLAGSACPPVPSMAQGYVWPIYDSYDIFTVRADGSGLTRLTSTPGYDAEATIAKDGRIVFTSVRDGDMEIYSMAADGSDVRRLTNLPGPDGGPFFSPDGSKIVFRGRHPQAGAAELGDYFALLKQAIWRPTGLELYVMDRDGSNLRQVTKLGGANFAPFFTPDGKRIIFSSNFKNPKGRDFDLYLVTLDGMRVEQVTFSPAFDGFPMFSPDGRLLVFASNRNQAKEGETNVFIAEWRE